MSRTELAAAAVQIRNRDRYMQRLELPDEPSPWLHRLLVLGALAATCVGFAMTVGVL